MTYYKTFTHDLRSPIQGGEPVWDGSLPYDLPVVEVDESDDDCGKGWNFCREAHTALRIGGMWPNGWPSRLFVVEPLGTVVERGDKCRTSQLRIVSELTDLRTTITELSSVFDPALRDEMVAEQLAWREALARPARDERVVQAGLRTALEARGLNWKLKRFETAWYARVARADWDASDARDACDARAAWAAWDAWDAWDALSARAACAAWDDWSARDASDAWAAWDAWDALTVFYAAKKEWIDRPANLLTTGIREAYRHGLEIALPVGPNTLGWAMTNGEK